MTACGQQAHLIDLDGREYGSVHVPDGRELAAGVGWSPDGRFLATVPWISEGPFDGSAVGDTGHAMFLWKVGDVDFLPVTDASTPPTAVQDVVQLLGWRSADSLIVATIDPAGHVALAEVQLGTGTRQMLSRFDTGRTCELGSRTCRIFDLHLATGLLPDLTVRNAGRPATRPLAGARECRHRHGGHRRREPDVAPETSVGAPPQTAAMDDAAMMAGHECPEILFRTNDDIKAGSQRGRMRGSGCSAWPAMC